MVEESLMTTVFKLLNVAALAGAGLYVFKTRVLKSIRNMMGEKKHQEKLLQDEKHGLNVKLKKTDDEIIQQQQLCARITNNVTRWNEVVTKEQELLLMKEQETMNEQEERAQQQSAHLTTLKIQQKVMPKAVEDAQAELERMFTQERSYAYMQNVVRHIRKA